MLTSRGLRGGDWGPPALKAAALASPGGITSAYITQVYVNASCNQIRIRIRIFRIRMFLGIPDSPWFFHHQAKMVEKPLFLLFYDLFMTFYLIYDFLQVFRFRIRIRIRMYLGLPDPLDRGTDPRIRIRTKMSRIHNKARKDTLQCLRERQGKCAQISVGDLDPDVFGPPGSGPVSYKKKYEKYIFLHPLSHRRKSRIRNWSRILRFVERYGSGVRTRVHTKMWRIPNTGKNK